MTTYVRYNELKGRLMDLNRVILIGRMATDPEMKYTPSGIAVTQFRLAVNRPMSAEARQNGQEKQADFISIVAWRGTAEFASTYLTKGRLIAVEGRLQVREYQTQDGQKRRDVEVIAETLKSLDRPKEGGETTNADSHEQRGAEPATRQRSAAATPPARPANYAPAADDELDDPFAD